MAWLPVLSPTLIDNSWFPKPQQNTDVLLTNMEQAHSAKLLAVREARSSTTHIGNTRGNVSDADESEEDDDTGMEEDDASASEEEAQLSSQGFDISDEW